MVRRLSRLALFGLAVLICCASFPRAGRLTQQYVTSPLLDNALDFLYFAVARKAGLEAWFCLKGFVDPRTKNAVLQTLSPVFVDSADGANIVGRPAGCRAGADSVSIVGTVHFHPDMNQCEFSETDLITAHGLPYEIEAIMCRDDADTLPHLLLAFRRQIDSAYTEIRRRTPNGTPLSYNRAFTPAYRFTKRADSLSSHSRR